MATYADRKGELLETLKAVIDPDLGQDIVSLGFVQDISFEPSASDPTQFATKFSVELTTPACPVKEEFQSDCKRLAEGIPWVSSAEVVMTAQAPKAATDTGALANVGAIIAVASCKGGVGKSTTAVNLAYALSASGASVGVMDADIYGPSLPTMVRPDSEMVQFEGQRIKPLTANGVKLMSFGYVNSASAIMRGPMIASMLVQLLTTTEWGVLDYLVVDLPPGTGDIQLTLSQTVALSAAVIVTTPQKLAFVDVAKGIDMFQKVDVPCVAVVENMAYFTAPDTGTKHFLFGRGHRERLQRIYGIESSFGMPLDPQLCEESDNGTPLVVAQPESESAERFRSLAASVVREVAKVQHGGLKAPEVVFDAESGDILVTREGSEHVQRIWPPTLRRQCRCALCVDEMSGVVTLKPEDIAETVKPNRIGKVGNYAIDVSWSDGHESLYPYSRFVDDWPAPSAGRKADQSAEVASGAPASVSA